MPYIAQSDIENYMDSEELDQIIDGDTSVLNNAISDAEENAREMLIQRYDVDAEYQLVGVARNSSLVKNVVAIAAFYLVERLPLNNMPQAREDSYIRAQTWLKEVASGSRNLDIAEIDAENKQGYPVKFGAASRDNTYL